MPNVRGPCFSTCARNPAATRSSASSHVAGRCFPFSRINGVLNRPLCPLFMACLSHHCPALSHLLCLFMRANFYSVSRSASRLAVAQVEFSGGLWRLRLSHNLQGRLLVTQSDHRID